MLYIAEKVYEGIDGDVSFDSLPENTFIVKRENDVRYYSEIFREGTFLSIGDCVIVEDDVSYFFEGDLVETLEQPFHDTIYSADSIPDDQKEYLVIRESKYYSVGDCGEIKMREGNVTSIRKSPDIFYMTERRAFASLDEEFYIYEHDDEASFPLLESNTVFSIVDENYTNFQLKNLSYISDVYGNLGEIYCLEPLSYEIKVQSSDERIRNISEYVFPEVMENIPNTHIGYTGSTGYGYTGSQGITGYVGSQGDPGTVGYVGSIGYTGSKGDKGIDGTIGYTGSQGEPGRHGYDGSRGIDGKHGYTGSTGSIGYTGSEGIRGIIGYTGSVGEPGLQGYTGSIGYVGSQGEPGDITAVTEEMERVKDIYMKDFSSFKNNITNMISRAGVGGGSSGGGSAKILDNDDVVFNKPSELNNNDVLIFDQSIQKFRAINMVTIINDIRADLEMQYDRLVFEDSANNITYIGEAVPGASANNAVWRIKRIREYTSGPDLGLTEILWADDTDDFDKIWDDRDTYTYDR